MKIDRKMLRIFFVAIGWLGFVPLFCSAGQQPNIVVFLSDDHGYLDSSVYGATDVKTPNMQRLAKNGVTFTHAFVASPSCAPSRAALLTGLMPARNGAEANHSYAKNSIRTLPTYLQQLGYVVAAFGKVAHGADLPRHGFDHANNKMNKKLVANFLAQRDCKKPLCLFVGTRRPHVPWPENNGYDPKKLNLPPSFVDTPETREFRARYYSNITTADRELGEIYDLVRKTLGDNTLFIYTSDHGAQWPFGKWNLYDAGIRTPFIAAWPGVIERNTKCDAMISWIDLLPTFVELAGGEALREIDGKSFAEVLRGKRKTHRDEIFTTHSGDGQFNVYPIRSIRTRRFHYILNLHPEYQHTTHIDKAQGKDGLIVWQSWLQLAKSSKHAQERVRGYYQRPKEELYDVLADPHEMKNLAALPEFQNELKDLRSRLNAWMIEQNDTKKVFNEPHIIGPKGPQPIKPVSPNAQKKKVGKSAGMSFQQEISQPEFSGLKLHGINSVSRLCRSQSESFLRTDCSMSSRKPM